MKYSLSVILTVVAAFLGGFLGAFIGRATRQNVLGSIEETKATKKAIKPVCPWGFESWTPSDGKEKSFLN